MDENSTGSKVCHFCKSTIFDSEDFFAHVRTYHHNSAVASGWIPCSVCALLYPDGASLKLHMDDVHFQDPDLKKFACDFCEARFASQLGFASHVNRLHRQNVIGKWISCGMCDDFFEDSELVESHKKWKHRKKPWKGAKLKDVNEKKPQETYKRRGQVLKTDFSCFVCQKNLSSLQCLNQHLRFKHHSEIEKIWKSCHICSLIFPDERSLLKHVQKCIQSTSKRNPTLCQFCFQTYFNKECCISHANECHKTKVAEFWTVCIVCMNYFPSEDDLDKHVSLKHKEDQSGKSGEIVKKKMKKRRNKLKNPNRIESQNSPSKIKRGSKFPNAMSPSITSYDKQCLFCSMFFAGESAYHTHAYQVHKDIVSREWLQKRGICYSISILPEINNVSIPAQSKTFVKSSSSLHTDDNPLSSADLTEQVETVFCQPPVYEQAPKVPKRKHKSRDNNNVHKKHLQTRPNEKTLADSSSSPLNLRKNNYEATPLLKQLLTSVPKSSTATTKVLRDIRVKSLKVLTGVDTSDKGDCFEESFNNNSGIYDAESLLPSRSSIQDSVESEKISCQLCPDVFTSSHDFVFHSNSKHRDIIEKKSWQFCSRCLWFFPSKKSLRNHDCKYKSAPETEKPIKKELPDVSTDLNRSEIKGLKHEKKFDTNEESKIGVRKTDGWKCVPSKDFDESLEIEYPKLEEKFHPVELSKKEDKLKVFPCKEFDKNMQNDCSKTEDKFSYPTEMSKIKESMLKEEHFLSKDATQSILRLKSSEQLAIRSPDSFSVAKVEDEIVDEKDNKLEVKTDHDKDEEEEDRLFCPICRAGNFDASSITEHFYETHGL